MEKKTFPYFYFFFAIREEKYGRKLENPLRIFFFFLFHLHKSISYFSSFISGCVGEI
jgi:hypothetical protein